MQQRKIIVYLILFILALLLNIYYFRQYLIENWLKYNINNEFIVITLSTTPHRINMLAPTLQSLTAQNAPVKAIYLNIPHVFKRENIEYEIPPWLANFKGITILRGEDYGPATKLLGTLKNVDLPPNAIIITVDDDVIYPPNLVLHLAYAAKQNPGNAIGLMGANPDYDANGIIPEDSELGLVKVKVNNRASSILQGYAGVAYRRRFFDESIFNISLAPSECINSDDIYLSFFLASRNVPRKVLRNSFLNACHVHWETQVGTDAYALHNLVPKPTDKHRSCIAYLKQQDPKVPF